MKLEKFSTTRTAATTHVLAYLRRHFPKKELFWIVCNVSIQNIQRWKKIPANGFHQCKLLLNKRVSWEYEQNGLKIGYWKIVANAMRCADIGELSSVEKLFWVNHATTNARKSSKRTIIGRNFVLEKNCWFYLVKTQSKEPGRKMHQKCPKKPTSLKKRSFLSIGQQIANKNHQDYYQQKVEFWGQWKK